MGGGCGPGLVAICHHVVLVVSLLCGLVVVPSFCVLVVVLSSCIVVVAHTSFVVGMSRCGHGGCGVVWLWCGVVVVWWYGRCVHGVNDDDG